MGRFERDKSEDGRLSTSLGSATEDLRTTVESEVTKIVERAEARAAEIEDQAREKASRIEHDSARRVQEVLVASKGRLDQMLAEVDRIETSVGETVRALREEAERLTGRIEAATAEAFQTPPSAPEAESEREPRPEAEPVAVAEPAAEEPARHTAQKKAEAEPSVTEPDISDSDVRDMIRQQLMSLAESGRARADAERMLLRFREGERYFDLLDEVYPERPTGRRGLLKRRK